MQTLTYVENEHFYTLTLPDPHEEAMPGVLWGKCEQVFTPAYWAYQAHRREKYICTHRLGETLLEEVAACLLGGYGIPAEVGLAAFYEIKHQGCLSSRDCSSDDIYVILNSGLKINGKKIKYRFAKQKSKYIADAILQFYNIEKELSDASEMRSWLLRIKGIGPKTASWITRNWLRSDEVAIIDIHIFRAGLIAGFFSNNDSVTSDYFNLEKKFLKFSKSIKTKASTLDAIMWADMRIAPKTVSSYLA